MITTASLELYTEHRGLARIQAGLRNLRQTAARLGGARGATSLLLAATVSALMVAANALIDSWSEGHLLAAWLVLWGVAFAGMAILAAPTRNAVAWLRSAAQACLNAGQSTVFGIKLEGCSCKHDETRLSLSAKLPNDW